MNCSECGQLLPVELEADGAHTTCKLLVESIQPPQSLIDMEAIAACESPEGAAQHGYAEMKAKDPFRFAAILTAAQNGYRAHLRGLEKNKGPSGPTTGVAPGVTQEIDEGSERAEERCMAILEKAKKAADEARKECS